MKNQKLRKHILMNLINLTNFGIKKWLNLIKKLKELKNKYSKDMMKNYDNSQRNWKILYLLNQKILLNY